MQYEGQVADREEAVGFNGSAYGVFGAGWHARRQVQERYARFPTGIDLSDLEEAGGVSDQADTPAFSGEPPIRMAGASYANAWRSAPEKRRPTTACREVVQDSHTAMSRVS